MEAHARYTYAHTWIFLRSVGDACMRVMRPCVSMNLVHTFYPLYSLDPLDVQRKRVNIGMELVADPTILFLDEVRHMIG